MTTLRTDDATYAADDAVAPYAELRESHSAVVFLVGDRAFKLKKPVDLGFLDFSSPARRLRACQRELDLNRRLAPDVYLGISDLNDVDGKPLEHLLVMRRMPAARRLATLVTTGNVSGGGPPDELAGDLALLASVVASFHRSAVRNPEVDACGTRDAVAGRWEANLTETRPYVGSWLDADAHADVSRLSRRYLAGRVALFEERIREGRVVDGHGDLLAEDIFLLGDGPRILDCLEFDDRLRYLDAIDDVACLVMDLEHLGAREAGQLLLAAYLEAGGDRPPDSLVHHYIAYRAFMRAKVACLPGTSGHGRHPASTLLELARRHLDDGRVRLLLVGGPPGTGKSTTSSMLAPGLDAVVLSSDAVRKELAGVTADTPMPAAYLDGIYAPEWSARTYDELLRRARRQLELGRSVILDASWSDADHRAAAARLAELTSSDLDQLCCVVSDELGDERVRSRSSGSDADTRIAAEIRARFAPWPEAAAVDTSLPAEEVVTRLLHRLRPRRTVRPPRPYMLPD